MNRTEERLRDALLATADIVDERRPESLPAVPGAPAGRLVPVLAAASVLIVLAVSLLAVEHTRGGDRHPQAGASMPPFYVTIAGGPRVVTSQLEVRRAETGRVTAVYASSDWEQFLSVAAFNGGKDFLILSQESESGQYPEEMRSRCQPLHVYRMSLTEDGKITGFARAGGLPALSAAATDPAPLAVTPDGKKIAFGARRCAAGETDSYEVFVIQLNENRQASLSLEWITPAGRQIGSLSWSADGRTLVSYAWELDMEGPAPYRGKGEVRVLTPAPNGGSPGGRVVLGESQATPQVWGGLISPDGRRISAVLNSAPRSSASGGVTSIVEVSVADGRVLRTVYRDARQPAPSDPRAVTLKRDASGGHLLMGSGGLIRIEDGRGYRLPGFSLSAGGDFAW